MMDLINLGKEILYFVTLLTVLELNLSQKLYQNSLMEKILCCFCLNRLQMDLLERDTLVRWLIFTTLGKCNLRIFLPIYRPQYHQFTCFNPTSDSVSTIIEDKETIESQMNKFLRLKNSNRRILLISKDLKQPNI